MSTPSADDIRGHMVGFDVLYGLNVTAFSEHEVRAEVVVRDEICQPVGLVHGGVYASIAESIASLATAVGVLEKGDIAMGQSNATSFLRPITEGTVHAVAVPVHRGRTTWVWDVSFTDDHEPAVRGHPDDDCREAGAGREPARRLTGAGARGGCSGRSGAGIWSGSGFSEKPVSGSASGQLRARERGFVDRHRGLRRRTGHARVACVDVHHDRARRDHDRPALLREAREHAADGDHAAG